MDGAPGNDRTGEDDEMDRSSLPTSGGEGSRGGLAATIVAILAGLMMVGGIALVVIALSREEADPPPELSTPDTNLEVVPVPAVTGCWAVQPGDTTFVGYRVNEQLLSVETSSEVTGRTPGVEGGLIIRGEEVVAGIIAADMSQLTSDDSERDAALRTRGLETDLYPSAVFALTDRVTIPAPIVPGSPTSLRVTGDLTLHGVTQPVTLDVQAQLLEVGGEPAIELIGTAPVVLGDHQIEPPDVGGVLTVADEGQLELQLLLVEDPDTCAAIAAEVDTSDAQGGNDTTPPDEA